MAHVCVESCLVLHATVRSTLGTFITRTLTNYTTRNDCLAFPDGNVHLPDNVNVSEKDESADEHLDSCIKRSFLSHRQYRLIYQQLRNSDSCLEENFSALMHGNNSDGRVCS